MTDSIKRRGADGVVYERLSGRAHIPENSKDVRDLHWCSGTGDNPAPITLDTPTHFCFIWAKSEDQSWEPPALKSPSAPASLDELFQQAQLIAEEGSQSQLAKIQTLALLYQAKALERIASDLDVICQEVAHYRSRNAALQNLMNMTGIR